MERQKLSAKCNNFFVCCVRKKQPCTVKKWLNRNVVTVNSGKNFESSLPDWEGSCFCNASENLSSQVVLTDADPDPESGPGEAGQLEHQVDVEEHGERREEGHAGRHERKFLPAFKHKQLQCKISQNQNDVVGGGEAIVFGIKDFCVRVCVQGVFVLSWVKLQNLLQELLISLNIVLRTFFHQLRFEFLLCDKTNTTLTCFVVGAG